MSDQDETVTAALRRARRSIAKLLRGHPKLGGPLGEILSALVDIEESLAHEPGGQIRATAGTAVRSRRGKPKRYERHERGGEMFVAEYRPDSPYPFRVPKATLDEVVEVLATSDRPLRFVDLSSAVAKRLGDNLVNYQLHVCLRLLASGGLTRVRGRTYAPADPKAFRRKFGKLWKELPADSDL